MSVYLAMPSKRPVAECLPTLRQWQERGYRVVLQRDEADSPKILDTVCWDIAERPYAGYPEAANHLCRCILEDDSKAEWIVLAGDDTLPDQNLDAEQIARECSEHFRRIHYGSESHHAAELGPLATYGVMQPTGDDWSDAQGRCIERIAGSPWIGREFARRMYGGGGPLCEEYFHMGADEELMSVATMLGVFWQRPDLVHLHNHWGRPRPGEKMAHASRMPAFLKRANGAEEWKSFKETFARRKSAGWPGHEAIA